VTGRDRSIAPITRMQFMPFVIDRHYAHRCPSVSMAFGLFIGPDLEGVITYGTPASAPLRSGLCGPEYAGKVLELNRLCLKANVKNDASWLVSASLRLMARDAIIVSFADKSQAHTGTVYQAANFLYCGLSANRTDWKIRGLEHLHGQTVADEFRGSENRAALMREKYGSDFYLAPRSRKHRYVMMTGTRAFRRCALSALRYPVEPYPSRS